MTTSKNNLGMATLKSEGTYTEWGTGRPLTPEEIEQAKKEQQARLEMVNQLKEMLNQHMSQDLPMSDEDRAKITDQIRPHDLNELRVCRNCGLAEQEIEARRAVCFPTS